jgi:hypothetical protein
MIEIKYQPSKRGLRPLLLREALFQRGMIGLCALVLIATMFVYFPREVVRFSAPGMASSLDWYRGCGAAIFLFSLAYLFVLVRGVMRSGKRLQTMRFGDEGIIFDMGDYETQMRWESLSRWSETRDYFLLYFLRQRVPATLPKSAFSKEALNAFIGYLQRRDATPPKTNV